METPTVIQGRLLTSEDLDLVLALRKKFPAWSQYQLRNPFHLDSQSEISWTLFLNDFFRLFYF
jgi:hypothetical protein